MEETRKTDAETKVPIIDYKAVSWLEKAWLVEIWLEMAHNWLNIL